MLVANMESQPELNAENVITETYFNSIRKTTCRHAKIKLKQTSTHTHLLKKEVSQNSHKKAELALLRSYVENQTILEPILLYHHQNVNKPKSRAVPIYVIVSFFLISIKMLTKQDQTCHYRLQFIKETN